MDKDTSSISSYNHSVSLLERKTLVITGVKKIENFDSIHFLLETTMGYMIIKGDAWSPSSIFFHFIIFFLPAFDSKRDRRLLLW